MPKHTLYAYVDGFDLDKISDDLHQRFVEFVAIREWKCPNAWAVNPRREPEPTLQPNDLPPWELGLNVELPDPGKEPKGWFSDIDAVALFAAGLHRSTGRSFIIGISEAESGIAEDLFSVNSDEPDLTQLRTIVGVGEIS